LLFFLAVNGRNQSRGDWLVEKACFGRETWLAFNVDIELIKIMRKPSRSDDSDDVVFEADQQLLLRSLTKAYSLALTCKSLLIHRTDRILK
jgi:hypothetical protein